MRFQVFSVASVAAASLALTSDAVKLSNEYYDYDTTPEGFNNFAEIESLSESESETYVNGQHRMKTLREVISHAH